MSKNAIEWAEQMAREIESTPSVYLTGERERVFKDSMLNALLDSQDAVETPVVLEGGE